LSLTAQAETRRQPELPDGDPAQHARRVRGRLLIDICNLIHAHGDRVAMDGANMNAQVGLTSPAAIRGGPTWYT
jgi:hypothetical protein